MELLGTVVNAVVVAAVGIVLARMAKGQFDDVRRQFDDVRRRLDDHDRRLATIEGTLRAHDVRLASIEGILKAHDARFDAIQARMATFETRMGSFERALDGMRSDLTRVALAVGAGPAAEAGAGP